MVEVGERLGQGVEEGYRENQEVVVLACQGGVEVVVVLACQEGVEGVEVLACQEGVEVVEVLACLAKEVGEGEHLHDLVKEVEEGQYLHDLVKEVGEGQQVCLHGLVKVGVEVAHQYSDQGEEGQVVEGVNQGLAQEQ